MQFTKTILSVVACAVAVSAAPQGTTSPASCTAGTATCCTTVTTPANATQTYGEGMLNGILGALTAPLVALGCSAIPIGGSECADTPVCCAPNTLGESLVGVGCIPIGISL